MSISERFDCLVFDAGFCCAEGCWSNLIDFGRCKLYAMGSLADIK